MALGKKTGGRQAGTLNKNTAATREIIERAAADGVLPLQVMFDNIRFYTKQADELIAKLVAGGGPNTDLVADDSTEKGDEQRRNLVEAIGQIVGLRKAAGEEAARAAPYCHARLAPTNFDLNILRIENLSSDQLRILLDRLLTAEAITIDQPAIEHN